MKNSKKKMIISCLVILFVTSCQKSESISDQQYDSAETTADSVSYAAKQTVEGKKFVKTSDIDMEVKDVYDATVFIENSLKNFGGFVTKSHLTSSTVSENTYNTSDVAAVLVKKFQTENTMQVRIPTQYLGDFLQAINSEKLFLNHRTISAEDVTANIKMQELEAQRNQKTAKNIAAIKAGKTKVEADDDNMQQGNDQKIAGMQLEDQLKYSTVDIFIKEPRVRTVEIPVANSGSVDNKYKFNFLYEAKNGFINGFYFIQRLFVLLITVWPLWLMFIGILLLVFRVRKSALKKVPKS